MYKIFSTMISLIRTKFCSSKNNLIRVGTYLPTLQFHQFSKWVTQYSVILFIMNTYLIPRTAPKINIIKKAKINQVWYIIWIIIIKKWYREVIYFILHDCNYLKNWISFSIKIQNTSLIVHNQYHWFIILGLHHTDQIHNALLWSRPARSATVLIFHKCKKSS